MGTIVDPSWQAMEKVGAALKTDGRGFALSVRGRALE
jgi:hypothetical protein